MRLLTVGSLPPEWGGPVRGGVATFHASLLTGLLEHRQDVEVVGVLPPAPLDRELPVPVFARPEQVSRADFYEDLLGRLQPDAVLMNHVAHTVGVTHARLRAPIPAVGVVHSWNNVTFGSADRRSAGRVVTEEALTGMAGVVLPSRHALAEGLELDFRYPLIAEVIRNPLPPSYMDERIRVRGRERRDIVYLGQLRSIKNPLALVEAAALLPAARVVFAGQGELEDEVRKRIEARSLGHRVRLAGALPEVDHLARVRDLLLGARVVCLPSHSESFGLVLIEALACGTPVVGFGPAVREIRDELGIEVGEPLDTGSPEEIAAAIERVSATTWDRDRLRRATTDGFGLPRITERYLELLGRVTTLERA